MAKTSRKSTEYSKYPRYPRHLETLAPANVIVIKKFLDLTWSQSQQITNQIMAAVRQAAQAHGGKTTNGVAMGKWRDLLQPHVYNVLMSGGDWNASQTNVLLAAASMGDIAAILTTGAECKENQLKAAFRAAKANTVCQAGVGGGGWCSFDWL